MEMEIKDVGFLIVQVVTVAAVIVSNKQNITFLKQQNQDLKTWLKELQTEVNNIRVKIGV